jgi:membrane fusion protein, multidrug efflux system
MVPEIWFSDYLHSRRTYSILERIVGFMSRKASIFIAAALLIGVLSVSGCGSKSAAGSAAPPQLPLVTASPVTVRDIPIYIDEIGRCAAPETVSVLPQVSGRITEVHFKEGADVKKGAPLFTIDQRPFKVQLDQAQAELASNIAAKAQSEATVKQHQAYIEQMKAELQQSKGRLQLNEMELERATNLLQTNAIARQEYDSKKMAAEVGSAQVRASSAAIAVAEAQMTQSKAAIGIAEARMAASQSQIQAAELNLEYTSILSPIDGRAGQRLVDAGNVVHVNNPTPLVVIQSLDPVYIDFTIPERNLADVRKSLDAGNLKIEARIPEMQDKPRTGDVIFLDNAVLDATGTVKLRASIPNADRFFWPGQFVKVRLLLGSKKDATLVPTIAIQIGQTGTFVYVVDSDSKAQMRPVKLGQRHDDLTAIEEGLNPGDNVILTGQMMVFPTAPVKIAPPPQSPRAAGAEKGTGDKGTAKDGAAK